VSFVVIISHNLPIAYSQVRAPIEKVDSSSYFKITQRGEMLDPDGLHFAFTNYQAPDGTKLLYVYREFDSPGQAQQYLEKEVHKAKIIKRIEKKDEGGKVASLRIETLIVTSDSKPQTPSVFWTNGPHFHQIICDSFPHIFDLEKKFSK